MSDDERARLLCVDDDANVLAALDRQLRHRYALVLGHGPVAGLERLRDQGPFAVIVSDLHMPGMDGRAFLAAAREIAPHAVGVLLTGGAELDPRDDDFSGLVFRVLPKPCDPDVLLATLDAAVAHRRLALL